MQTAARAWKAPRGSDACKISCDGDFLWRLHFGAMRRAELPTLPVVVLISFTAHAFPLETTCTLQTATWSFQSEALHSSKRVTS